MRVCFKYSIKFKPNLAEDDQKCNFDEPEKLMQIDSTLSLSFCQPVQDITHSKCLGRRQLVRVMGKIHENGEALIDVDDTAVFCRKYLNDLSLPVILGNCPVFHRDR
jgi:hypothetical protein